MPEKRSWDRKFLQRYGFVPKRQGLPERVYRHLRRDLPLALLDACVVLAAYLVPLVLRFDAAVPERYWDAFRVFMPAAVALHLASNYLFGLYGQMWRYASVQEARRVVLAAALGGVFVLAASSLLGGLTLPRSVVILGAMFTLIGLGAIRFQSRLFAIKRLTNVDSRERVLLVGAGEAGAMVLKDMLRNPTVGLNPVGFVDDDERSLGLALHGVAVLGRTKQIPSLVRELKVDRIFLTIPSATGDMVRDIAELAEEAEVTLRVLPSMSETMGGKVTVRDMRDLKIEDLLGRQQVETDLASVCQMVTARRVLITGAGGSIGSEIVRQVAAFDPAELVLLDNDETHLHDVAVDLEYAGVTRMVLADIRDQDRIAETFMRLKPEVVFHAAAHKHVPILESNPSEAVLTNIIGTANVADASVAAGVSRFVLISTDKAIRPASVMGASKWFAEQIVRSLQWNGCVFCAVRFGNVVGSRGSVIPTFIRQINRGGPVTVTDPNMRRYFMSVQEAVQLVLQAGALAEGGEVFTLDMGEPVNILDLAKRLIRLAGKVPGRDVEIEIIGARPGEKVLEEIVAAEEEVLDSGHPSIVAAKPPVPDGASLRAALHDLEGLAREGRVDDLLLAIKTLALNNLLTETASEGVGVRL